MVFKSKAGQATVLVLLLALMGLTVGMSVASRSLSDLKQVSFVDYGTKTFAGAEAGLEYALNQLTANPLVADCTDHKFTVLGLSMPTGIKEIIYNICQTDNAPFVIFNSVSKDDVREIDLSTIQSNNTKGADIIWSNKAAGIEVIDIGDDGKIVRYVFTGSTADGFSPSTGFGQSFSGNLCKNTNCVSDGTFDSGLCTSDNSTSFGAITLSKLHKLLRIKPIFTSAGGTTNIAVCGRATGASIPDIGSSTYDITVTAISENNTTKKITVQKLLPTLPSIFDYAIYTRGSLTK